MGKINQILPCDWLLKQARWGYVAGLVLQENGALCAI